MSFTRQNDGVKVTFNGKTVPSDIRIEVSCRAGGFKLNRTQNVVIKGFVFYRQSGDAISIRNSTGCTLEDCHIVQPKMHGIRTPGSTPYALTYGSPCFFFNEEANGYRRLSWSIG